MKTLILTLFGLFIFNNIIFSKWEIIKSPKENFNAEFMFENGDTIIFINNEKVYYSIDKGENWEFSAESNIEGYATTRNYNLIGNKLFQNTYSIPNLNTGILISTDLGYTWEEFITLKTNESSKCLMYENDKYYYLSNLGFFSSSNAGNNWEKISNTDSIIHLDHIEMKNNNILVADEGYDKKVNYGIYISTDGGYYFEKRINGIENINSKMFNFVRLYDDYSLVGGDEGLYISSDLGENWSLVNIDGSNKMNLTSFERVDNIFYTGTSLGEIYKSEDFGENWELIYNNNNNGKVSLIKNIGNKVHFSISGKIYGNFVLDGNSYNESNFKINSNNRKIEVSKDEAYIMTKKNVFKTDNTFENWEKLTDFEYFEYSKFYADGDNIILNYEINNKFMISNDDGKTWNEKEIGNSSNLISDIFRFKDKIFISTIANGLITTEDFGQTWINYNDENPDNLYLFRYFKSDNNKIYCGSSYNGILVSEDDGNKWVKLSQGASNPMSDEAVFEFAINGENIVAQASFSKAMMHSSDLGKTWVELSEFENSTYVKSLINYKENFFIISQSGFYYSVDNGKSWTKFVEGINELKFSNMVWETFELAIFDGNLILAYSDNIYKLPLSVLGIEYTSVENIEKRNYLYTFPPFPQPTKSEVKINTYWDSALPFTTEDIEIYNLSGVKINTTDKLRIIKETNYNGHIIWDTSNEEAGIYIVYIKHGTELRVCKILVK